MSSLEILKLKLIEEGYPRISDLQADGEYHRFAIPGHGKGYPGYYLAKETATGFWAVFGDFVSGRKHFLRPDNNNKNLSTEEVEELVAKLADEAKKFEAKLKRKHEKGAMAARFFWETGRDANSHPYLKDKRVKCYGAKVCDLGDYANWLMVPGCNAPGELCTMQYINRDGQKRFETDSQMKGASFEMTGDGKKIVIAEGYATGASIYEATGHTVIVAFDAGNLAHVAKIIREKCPDSEIILAADNDQWKPDIGNIGVNSAKNVAIEIDAKLAIPKFKHTETKPTDYNDLARLEGLGAVRGQIEAAAPVNKVEALKSEINKIIGLDPIEQEFERNRLSEKYRFRKGAIDQYIRQLTESERDVKSIVEEIAPAAEPVDGEKLLDGF